MKCFKPLRLSCICHACAQSEHFDGVFHSAIDLIQNPENVPYINICFALPIFVGTFITWVFIKRGKPLSPPSRSAALLANKKPPTAKEMLMDIKVLATGNRKERKKNSFCPCAIFDLHLRNRGTINCNASI